MPFIKNKTSESSLYLIIMIGEMNDFWIENVKKCEMKKFCIKNVNKKKKKW